MKKKVYSFRPLAGLSCINRDEMCADEYAMLNMFPSPRGVELHKPMWCDAILAEINSGFRPLAGLSCINLESKDITSIVDGVISFRPLAGLSCINQRSLIR